METETEIDRAVREAFEDLNYDMIPILARLSPERKFAMVGDLADFVRTSYIAQERRANPDLPPDEIRLRATERMLLRGGVSRTIVRQVCRRGD
jgi:hypothetical protein